MKIEFQQESPIKILVIGIDDITSERKQIGHIITPSGSGEDVKNAIQVCGFDEAFSLWGCGVFCDGENFKKDIQLMFKMDSMLCKHGIIDGCKHRKILQETFACMRCYNEPCTCEIKTWSEEPYLIKSRQDLDVWQLEKVKKK